MCSMDILHSETVLHTDPVQLSLNVQYGHFAARDSLTRRPSAAFPECAVWTFCSQSRYSHTHRPSTDFPEYVVWTFCSQRQSYTQDPVQLSLTVQYGHFAARDSLTHRPITAVPECVVWTFCSQRQSYTQPSTAFPECAVWRFCSQKQS